MFRSVCLFGILLAVGAVRAESPPSVADLVKQLGDAKFATREAAQKELLKRGEGIVPELDRLAKKADAETAERIRKLRYALVGYQDDIRRLLLGVHEGKDGGPVPVSHELRGLIATYQPGSGDLLVSILAQPDHRTYRQALRVFVSTWDIATPDQIDRYIQQAVTLTTNHRPKFPAEVGAIIRYEAQPRDGWTGWPPISGEKKVDFRMRTTRYVDGKPYGKPYESPQPFANIGQVKVGELPEGRHTIHAVMAYEFTQMGEQRKGEIRSKESKFDVVSADTPDDLIAPRSKVMTKAVRDAIIFVNYEGEDLTQEDLKAGAAPPTRERIWDPQVTWSTDKGTWAGLHVPLWRFRGPVDIDLCFDVSIREVKTGDVHTADAIVLIRRQSAGHTYVRPRNIQAFAKDRDGFVAVKILLKPSRALALSDPRVTCYFPDEIESRELKMKVIPKVEQVERR